jgi:hypothetical protein
VQVNTTAGEAMARIDDYPSVWVFIGTNGTFPAGVFSTRETAEAWITSSRVLGTLTRYPIDLSAYDWCLQYGFFKPKRAEQRAPEFIQKFSSASQDHFHYENGAEA